ncbi:hypothetical protein K523DRAFT_416504 [Schizophyllum commune Tattone D]|nr:hypothetical protein K523DRAFT_416504 [Schizophyllum commune Tattone D]
MTDTQDHCTPPHRNRLFGVRGGPQDRDDYERRGYEERYEDDALGEELGEGARVWYMFLEEGSQHDTKAFQGLRDHLDVDLVFSGLFAAVVTTCVVQSSQALQPDHAEISASLLSEMIAVQRAMANRSPVNDVPPSKLQPGAVTASALDYWTNRLWYLSLLLTLFAAFLAFVVRGWLYAYDNYVHGSPKRRALTRHYRRMGLDHWHVGPIVLILPTLLHASMLVFSVGLTLNLRRFDVPMANLAIALTGTFYALYFMSICLPVFFPQCPYRSPLSEWAYRLKAGFDWLRALSGGEEGGSFPKMWRNREEREVTKHADHIIAKGLDLALQESTDLSINSLVIQAASSLPFHPMSDAQADRLYGSLLRGRVLAWFFSTFNNRGFVFDWAPGREKELQRMACTLLLVPADNLSSSPLDDFRYRSCVTRILQALVHAIFSTDVGDSDMLILAATAVALGSRLDKDEWKSKVEFIGNEVLGARIASAYLALAGRSELGGLRVQPVVWDGMLRSLAYRCPSAYVPERLALLLWRNVHHRDGPFLVDDDRQGFPTFSTVTLQQWLHSTSGREYMILAQDAVHNLICPSSCEMLRVHDSCSRGAEVDAIISLHTICRAVEVHRNQAKPSDGATNGQAAADEVINFLSTQAIEALLASLHHGSLGTTWKIVGSSGVSLIFFSALVSRCRPSTLDSVEPRDVRSSILTGSLFWFLAKLLSALDDEREEPFGSGGPVSPNSSSSLPTPLLPASPATSPSSSFAGAKEQVKLDIIRAMEHHATASFSAVMTAGLLDELDPLAFLRSVVVTVLTDPHIALLGAMPRALAMTVAAHLKRLAVRFERAKETQRMDLSWCVFLDVLVAARATRDGPEAADALRDALILLRNTHGDICARGVFSAFENPIPLAFGIALASTRGCEALVELVDNMRSPLDYEPAIGERMKTLRVRVEQNESGLDEEWKQAHIADPEKPCHSDTVPISRLVSFEQYRERLHDERRVEIAHGDIERAEHPLRGGGSQAHVCDCGTETGGQEELDQAVENDAKPASARLISFRAAQWVRLRAILMLLSSKRRRGGRIEHEGNFV